MKIAIGGLTGSGKNTLGQMIAEKLGYRLVCPTFKDLAAKQGIPLMEFQKKAEKDPGIDRKFDALLKEEAGKGDCVITTWLGPWMIDADIKILVYASDDIRARRISGRDKMDLAEARKHVKQRDDENRQRYKKLYNIDIFDQSIYDIAINNGKMSAQKTGEVALAIVKAWKK
jgi:cytidylate kinase